MSLSNQGPLGFLDRQIQSGYDSGVWHSMIVHCVALIILAFLSDNKPLSKPRPIEISISDDAVPAELEAVAEMPAISELAGVQASGGTESVDTLAPIGSPEAPDIRVEPAIVSEFEWAALETSNTARRFSLASLTKRIKTTPSGANADGFEELADMPAAKLPPHIGSRHNSAAVGFGLGGDGDSEGMLARLAAAGAQTGDIQISIAWDNTNDIDLWVEFHDFHKPPERIGWLAPFGASGGWLDVDANAYPHMLTQQAVENIFWPVQQGRKGRYVVYANFFRRWDSQSLTCVKVRIKIGTKIIHKEVVLDSPGQFVKIDSFLVTSLKSFHDEMQKDSN